MLRTETVSKELLTVLTELMKMKSLQSFRLVGGTALSLQLGHRESVDIDLFSATDFPAEAICKELTEHFQLGGSLRIEGGIMIRTSINEIKVDIVIDKTPFIRDITLDNGIRMAHLEDIAATKIKMACDPFSGRKTQKDLSDIATLLDVYTLKQMVGFLKEKYPIMAPYEEAVIIKLKEFDAAELKSVMPKMHNGLTWQKTKEKIEQGLKGYFDSILKERELKLKNKNS